MSHMSDKDFTLPSYIMNNSSDSDKDVLYIDEGGSESGSASDMSIDVETASSVSQNYPDAPVLPERSERPAGEDSPIQPAVLSQPPEATVSIDSCRKFIVKSSLPNPGSERLEIEFHTLIGGEVFKLIVSGTNIDSFKKEISIDANSCGISNSATTRKKYAEQKGKGITCRKCEITFTSASEKKRHTRTAHWACKRCEPPMSFSARGSLTRHIRKEHDLGSFFACTVCDTEPGKLKTIYKSQEDLKLMHTKCAEYGRVDVTEENRVNYDIYRYRKRQ